MMANRAGRFRASVTDKGVSETGPNKLLTFIPRFLLLQESCSDGWKDIESEGQEITAYVYMERRDHSINDVALQQLKDAFGWDGRDPYWLEDSDLPVCQVTLDFETYQGEERLKVRWIANAEADGARVPKSTDDERKKVRTRIGAKLRAMAGGTPAGKAAEKPKAAGGTAPKATPPKRQAPSPAIEPPPTTPTAPPPAEMPIPYNQETAWTTHCDSCAKAGLTDAQAESLWWKNVQIVAGHQDPDRLTAEEWERVAKQATDVPF